jgi:hypothetical protein
MRSRRNPPRKGLFGVFGRSRSAGAPNTSIAADDLVPPAIENDPEFRPARRARRDGPAGEDPRYYVRLVANPFLAAFTVLLWIVLLRWLWSARIPPFVQPMVIFGMIAGLFAPFLFLHYHCLDCGATGRIASWQDHECEAVALRRRERKRRMFRGPTPPMQVVLWLWVCVVVAFLVSRAFL